MAIKLANLRFEMARPLWKLDEKKEQKIINFQFHILEYITELCSLTQKPVSVQDAHMFKFQFEILWCLAIIKIFFVRVYNCFMVRVVLVHPPDHKV